MLSGYEKYDALFEYKLTPSPAYFHNPHSRPFGVKRETFEANGGTLSQNILAEFKLNLDSIYSDHQHNKRNLREVELLICWDADESAIQAWGDELNEISNSERIFDGTTHKLRCGLIAGEIPVICLKTLLDQTGY
jgi:hypothetical protein